MIGLFSKVKAKEWNGITLKVFIIMRILIFSPGLYYQWCQTRTSNLSMEFWCYFFADNYSLGILSIIKKNWIKTNKSLIGTIWWLFLLTATKINILTSRYMIIIIQNCHQRVTCLFVFLNDSRLASWLLCPPPLIIRSIKG